MPAINESGHAINLANFNNVVAAVSALGSGYKPANTDISRTSLTSALTSADTAQRSLLDAVEASKISVNARINLFADLDKLVTRVVNMLGSTKASEALKRDAKALADRIRGSKVRVQRLPDGSADPADVSNSHQSYVMKQEAFQQLVTLLANEPLYAPLEESLQVNALQTLATSMLNANRGLAPVLASIRTLRTARNRALYLPGTGLLDRAADVKQYVKGAFGASSPEAKGIVGIRFTKPRPELLGDLAQPALPPR